MESVKTSADITERLHSWCLSLGFSPKYEQHREFSDLRQALREAIWEIDKLRAHPPVTFVPAPPAEPRCDKCRFWCCSLSPVPSDYPPEILEGRCRVRAPAKQGWPCTRGNDWCGEFKGCEGG